MIKYKANCYQFRPTLLGWMITLICIPLFIKFGLWQYGKAQTKINIQEAYEQSINDTALSFPVNILELNKADKNYWAYKKVAVTGTYEPKYAFLLDNQVESSRAGYHVITPLKITNSEHYVLVNRGWIPGNQLHTDVPNVDTPKETVKVEGQVWIPSAKFFTLEEKSGQLAFQPVRQNVDLAQYKKQVPMEVSALMIKLDPKSDAGGFVRNWLVPTKRIATHLGYAYQWFGFAITTLLIFIYMSFTRIDEKPDL